MFMKQVHMTLAFCGSLLFASGCGCERKSRDAADPKPAQDIPDPEVEPKDDGYVTMDLSHEANVELDLSSWQKWEVDNHTRQSAKTMSDLLNQTGPFASPSDATALAEALDKERASLVRGCTMTGPAHEQLHAFLEVLSPKIDLLGDEAELTELQMVRHELSMLWIVYNQYFE